MPAIPPGSLVLVTGASGFIAVHTIKTLLDSGYAVRGTVRSQAKGDYLADLFKASKAPFEYVIVEDIVQPGAFDEAVTGVAGVAHTASPFHFRVNDPQQLIEPAVKGTLGVLESIQKNNSCASIMDDNAPKPHVRTEKDWNETSIKNVEEQGCDARPIDMYRASKTLAERAFWKFIDDKKPNWDGATICPPMVYGPILQQVSSTSELNTSNANVLDWLTGNKAESDIPDVATFNWVDVRDVALAHVRALTVPEAGGERFIVGAGPGSPNDLVLSFERHFPERKTYPKGNQSKVEAINAKSNRYDGSKAERILGIKYHDIDTTARDTAESLIKRLGV
ncbi:hypothetical protein CspeluHIS016_0101800 [Cutaneotrichosporon spelunceum]|uniref:NAD-dependent epimerase/dehydratase domain-containing protein n=1 Tax=Cutaneotrichosporon spelunceum TaxID=1672016 RepID=A0AAD3TN78_9TREE|nr:hypothetical protein CspeluHIS016_0101800 [Cutaneotrichosporon spelunceum]